jgi:PAS domain S-box-containing protein
MTKINHALKMLVIIVTVFLMGYFLESFRYNSSSLGDYFEVVTELLPTVLAFSIFVTTWIAYRKNHDYFSLFLGEAFLIIWLFDTFHMLSLPYMPAFITPNSLSKAAFFWSVARLVSAILLLASAYIYKGRSPRLINMSLLLIATIVMSFLSLPVGLVYPDNIPYYPYRSQSDASVFIGFISSAIILYACFLYSRLKETGEKSIICLIYGFVIYALSNLVYSPYEYSGHLLKAAGYYFVYIALFRFSIEMPYEKSDEAKKKRIHEVEEKYRSLFDNANDAIITIDLEDRISSWNKAAEKIFGWETDEVIGKKVSELATVPPHLQTERDVLFQDAKSGSTVSGVETVRMGKDGTKIDVSLTISPLLDANKNITGFSSIIRDITERKQAEKILLDTNILLEKTFASLNEAVFVIVSATRTITMCNSAVEHIFGYRREEVLGRNTEFLYVNKEMYEEFGRRLFPALDIDGMFNTEYRMKRKDGTIFDTENTVTEILDDSGHRSLVVSVVRDITERKRAENEIRRHNRYLSMLYTIASAHSLNTQEILGNALDTILKTLETEAGAIYLLEDDTTLTLKVHSGFSEEFIKHGQYIKPFEGLAGKVFVEKKAVAFKVSELSDNLTPFLAHGGFQTLACAPLISADEPIGVLLTMSRIHEFRQEELELLNTAGNQIGASVQNAKLYDAVQQELFDRKKAEEQLEASLKEKEVLLREIHHRVKNNMQIISSLLKLQSGYSKDETFSEIFKESQNRIITMSLVHEKLYQSSDFTKIDFNEYIKDIVHGLYQSYGVDTGKVSLNVIVEDVSLGVDSAIPCGLIINELVTNSLKHAFSDGRKGEIKIIVHKADENEIELTICDNGIGIPESIDFRKTESLGLHLVTILVENQLHGKIYLDRSKGTEFKIRFKGVK